MLTGKYDLGVEQAMDALHLDPGDHGAIVELAEIYRHKGASQEALAQYEKASALVGDSPASVRSLTEPSRRRMERLCAREPATKSDQV